MRGLAIISLLTATLCGCNLRSPPPPVSAPVPVQNPGKERTDVLIYGGVGAWGEEIESIKNILIAHGKTYVEYDDFTFNELTETKFEQFSLVIFAGGNSDRTSQKLKPETKRNLQNAVINRGVNYLGFCSGAWLAVSPEPRDAGEHYGFQFLTGPWLEHTPYDQQNLHYSVVQASFPDGVTRKLLWFGGPITPDIPGGVVARYPDGRPAISQIKSGKGFVIISGLHPAATKPILKSLSVYEREAIAPELAWSMIDAGLSAKPMAAFLE